jgi:hypothetical protein
MMDMADELALGLNDPLPFGKYKGELVKEIIEKGFSDYLQYLLSKNDSFNLTSDVVEIIEKELGYYDDSETEEELIF